MEKLAKFNYLTTFLEEYLKLLNNCINLPHQKNQVLPDFFC